MPQPMTVSVSVSHVAVLAAVLLAGASPSAARAPRPVDPAAKMPPLKPAVIDDTLAIGGAEIGARKVRSRLTVEVGVNGTGPYHFVVDSGADTSVISERLAAALNLPQGRPALLNTITDSQRIERVVVDTLQVGSTAFTDLHLPSLAERDIGAAGIIGLDALVEQRLLLDFEKRKISVDDARRPAPSFDGEIVVTARLNRGQLILTQVRASGLQLNAVVDTGSEITIGNSALRKRLAGRRNLSFETINVIGVTGKKMALELTHISELKLGPITLRDVPVAFADIPPFEVFGINDQPSLLLGTDLMENFRRVSLDFRARKVRFQLRKCGSQVVTYTTSRSASILSADKDNASVCK